MAQVSSQVYMDQVVIGSKRKNKITKKTIAIIAGVVVVATFFSVLFLHRKEQNNIAASNMYNQLIMAMQKQDTALITNQSLALIKNYKNSPYARIAGLFLAKIAFYENNIDLAKERLNWVIQASKDDELIRPIAVARLARLLIHNKEYDEALALIDKQKFPAKFAVIMEEVRADAFLAKGDRESAMNSYKMVAKNLPDKVDVRWLEEKLNNLGVERDVTEVKNNKDN